MTAAQQGQERFYVARHDSATARALVPLRAVDLGATPETLGDIIAAAAARG